MRVRSLVACAVAALAVTAAAQAAPTAHPSRYLLVTTVAPDGRASLTIGAVPKGEFAFYVRVSSDDEKAFRLTQKRNGGPRFTVLESPGATSDAACRGAAGTLDCTGITTPATPAGRRWTFVFTNASARPMHLRLTIRWRPVTSAE